MLCIRNVMHKKYYAKNFLEVKNYEKNTISYSFPGIIGIFADNTNVRVC